MLPGSQRGLAGRGPRCRKHPQRPNLGTFAHDTGPRIAPRLPGPISERTTPLASGALSVAACSAQDVARSRATSSDML